MVHLASPLFSASVDAAEVVLLSCQHVRFGSPVSDQRHPRATKRRWRNDPKTLTGLVRMGTDHNEVLFNGASIQRLIAGRTTIQPTTITAILKLPN